jgi:type IV fimbrial biogenesis protein FimT
VVIIAIIGILTLVAIPGLTTWLPNYRLKAAARDLYSNMQLAKIGAVRANANWAIVFDVSMNPGRYFICSDDGPDDTWNGPAAMGNDDTVEKAVDLSTYKSAIDYGHGNASGPIGTTFDNEITYPDDVLVFNPRGTCNGGYVYLENSKHTSTYGVGTSTSGNIAFRKWNGTSWQ